LNGLETESANPARVYDALLGGKDNYEADRRAAQELVGAKPDLPANVRANRQFLGRAVRCLATGERICQYLDIGTGLPTMDNTHEVAQRSRPDASVVYVDNDPLVLVHGRALLTSTPRGTVEFAEADLRDPAAIIGLATQTLDLARPVAVMLLGILYLIEDAAGPYEIVSRLMAATAPGSYLVVSHPASDVHAEEAALGAAAFQQATGIRQTNRSRAEVTRFFDGLDLLPPGVVQANRWRPGPGDDITRELSNWAGVARKPG
jgi:O-methyltransferase involved in polyketide biosynthesis